MAVERRFISPRECAALIGCHVQSVYGYIDRGLIPAARLGRRVLIDVKKLEAKLEKGKTAKK
jgi:excisionase family DNA binding protein